MYKIGIDLGGTKIEAVVTDENYKELHRKRIPNGKEGGYENVLTNISALYNDLKEQIGGQAHTLGLGTPGSISQQTGLLKNSNIAVMNGKPFQQDLERILNHKIAIENDANLFALAEAVLGAGKGHDWVFGVIMGTGVGGGLIYKGQVIRGARENAGEFGHSTINFDNGPTWGNSAVKGIIEAYTSGTGLQARYKEKFGIDLPSADIVYNYRQAEPKSTEIFNEFLVHYGVSMGNIIKFLDPEVIVLGGGLSNVDELYSVGLEHVKHNCLGQDLYTPIRKNEFGDSAGVFGAAIIGVL